MRPENWPMRLALFHEEKAHQPFAWGSNDCCLFAADWVCILTGLDPAKEFRGNYCSPYGAWRSIQRASDKEGLVKLVSRMLSMEPVSISFARRGDVVSLKTKHGPALGVCDGARVMFPGREGISLVPLTACRLAWRIE